MIHALNEKKVLLIAPQATTTGAVVTSSVVDVKGWSHVNIDLSLATSTATTAPTALAIQGAHINAATNFASITKLTGGTNAGNFTIAPQFGTTAPTGVYLNANFRPEYRYYRLTITNGAAVSLAAIASLSRGSYAPTSATEAGARIQVSA